jgi:pimeloyl-ACP methyl ester carboxylesterase
MKCSTVVRLVALGTWSAAASAQPRMLNVGDASIRYDDTGRGQPIVFVHGWAQTLQIWDDQVAAFSSHYRVIRFDRRGCREW